MGIRAILTTIPYKIKQNFEQELFRDYIATGVKMLTETTANAFSGRKITMEYSEIIKGRKPEEEKTGNEIVEDILSKICRKEEAVEPI